VDRCSDFDSEWFARYGDERLRILRFVTQKALKLEADSEWLELWLAKHPIASWFGERSTLAPDQITWVEAFELDMAELSLLRGQWQQLRDYCGQSTSWRANLLRALAVFAAGEWDAGAAKIAALCIEVPERMSMTLSVFVELALVRQGLLEAIAGKVPAPSITQLKALQNHAHFSWRPITKARRTAIACAANNQTAASGPFVEENALGFVAMGIFAKRFLRVTGKLGSSNGHYPADLHWLGKLVVNVAAVVNDRRFPIEFGYTRFVPDWQTLPSFDDLLPSAPQWQLFLDRLRGQIPAADERTERLIWVVIPSRPCEAPVPFDLEPRLQKKNNASWSTGRRLASGNLSPQVRDGLSAVDRLLFDRLRNYSPAGCDDFAELVGNPRVFLGDDLATPITMERGSPWITVEASAAGRRLTLSPSDIDQTALIAREGSVYRLYQLTPEQAKVAHVLVGGMWIPEEGAGLFDLVLQQLASLFPVVSKDSIASAAMVPADPTIFVRLEPKTDGLWMSACVRPLGDAGPALLPGEGACTLMGHRDQRAVQTERDLAGEVQIIDQFVDQCPALYGQIVDRFLWKLTERDKQLDLVLALQNARQIQVEWPVGGNLRARGRVGRKSLKGRVSLKGAWFEVSGTLSLEGTDPIELAQLIDQMPDPRARWMALSSGDFVELEDDLRTLLADLQRAGEKDKQSYRVSAGVLDVVESLTFAAGWTVDAAAKQWRQTIDAAFAKTYDVPKTLAAELRPYQEDGFRWMARLSEMGLGCCLADDMGLGKTVQLIALILYRRRLGRTLVVAPTSVCENWLHEVQRFAPSLSVQIYGGPTRDPKSLADFDVTIVSYTILQLDAEVLQAAPWGIAIVDEAQFIKNAETQRAQAACGLNAKVRIAATGTPVENHEGDLYSLFRFVHPELLGSFASFKRRFCGEGEGTDSHGRRERLKRVIAPYILRRLKSAVLDDLPPITEIRRSVELTAKESAAYELLRRTALDTIEHADDSSKRFTILAELTRLRRFCCSPGLVLEGPSVGASKVEAFLELVDELVENRHRALVFSQFVDFLGLIRQALEARSIGYQYLDGSSTPKERAASVDAFQKGDSDLFLISLKAGGFGLNLTAADYVIHLDPWWNPAAEQQATDRAHRIGQSRPVTVYRLVTAQTIEEKIVELHHRKRALAQSLLDGSNATSISKDDLLGVFE
jgi:superfamily II DNA or RNA helicase